MNIKRVINFSIFSFCLLLSAPVISQNQLERPKLVVGIVVDQMRWDYLYRFSNRYGNDGFKRLLNEGFSCENTMLNYVPSFTAIGHSSIYTGSVPSIHGIAGNEFIVQATGKSVYCTEDTAVYSVGYGDKKYKKGQMSPFNLKATTITDELKLATNFKSKVIGVSIKDRGAILPAGHAADAAYWFDGTSGYFITSSWYMKELPKWVVDFNNKKLPEQYLKKDWNTLYPIDTYTQSVSDNNNYEELYENSDNTQFPIKTSQLMKKNGYGLIAATPYGNSLTLDMAKEVIANEQMGEHQNTDFLAVSISSPDYIGHQFTVNSVKMEDNYLRLDKDLADFFAYLDGKIGKGNYVLYLTADHGASHNAQFLLDNKIPAGNWDEGAVRKELNQYLHQTFGVDDLVLSLSNYQVNFNYKKITKDIDKQKLIENCIDFFKKQSNVAYVVETAKAAEAAIPSVVKEKIINGYNRELCGEIQIILKPAWYSDSNLKGGTHGVWNPYDAHIPLVWMGWGIKHGKSNQEVYMTDIAPTVAALLHIQMPDGCIGKPILPVLGQ
ncbi:MAG: alkaline phosphatase family protein [Bacteroidales bacterium 45-6]|nr:MAG: alkaline phosphatase family protein [Bacteroidales bacterium 45-6]